MKSYNITRKIENNDIIYKTLHSLLCNTKNNIENCNNWEYYKRLCNPYETIYTSDKKKNICLKIPISRSYFKLCEIMQDFKLNKKNEVVLCLAEAPGGFIEYIQENSYSSKIYANTYIKDEKNIPIWNKHILNNYLIYFTNSNKNNGDLKNIDNINDIKIQIQGDCDLITADGGIDYSNDYNNQELDSYELLYSEIYTALYCQKEGGCFIIKFFDIFYNKTIQLLNILYRCYDNVSFTKPYTSRPSNSEKYIICQGFKSNKKILNLMKYNWNKKSDIEINVDYLFYKIIYNYNFIFVNEQIDFINNVLNKQCDNICQKKLSLEWCKKYKMPYKI